MYAGHPRTLARSSERKRPGEGGVSGLWQSSRGALRTRNETGCRRTGCFVLTRQLLNAVQCRPYAIFWNQIQCNIAIEYSYLFVSQFQPGKNCSLPTLESSETSAGITIECGRHAHRNIKSERENLPSCFLEFSKGRKKAGWVGSILWAVYALARSHVQVPCG